MSFKITTLGLLLLSSQLYSEDVKIMNGVGEALYTLNDSNSKKTVKFNSFEELDANFSKIDKDTTALVLDNCKIFKLVEAGRWTEFCEKLTTLQKLKVLSLQFNFLYRVMIWRTGSAGSFLSDPILRAAIKSFENALNDMPNLHILFMSGNIYKKEEGLEHGETRAEDDQEELTLMKNGEMVLTPLLRRQNFRCQNYEDQIYTTDGKPLNSFF